MKILILGLGNLLLSDEGLGVEVIKALQNYPQLPKEVKILDGGTGGLALLPELMDLDVLLVVDAISLGNEPGTIYTFEKDFLFREKLLEKISTHEISFLDILALLQLKGQWPKEIYLFGIEPKKLEVGIDLSEEVKRSIPKLCELIIKKIKEITEIGEI